MRSEARIVAMRQETPTVRSFVLEVSPEFQFLAGQWVDCYAQIGGSLPVAGYSMISSPTRRGMIELAVKRVGDNPVTRFLHELAAVGDALYVDGGHGDFCFERGLADSLVLIGGGIGMTPLMSMLSYVDGAAPGVRVLLLHSARTPEELLFRDRIEDIARRNPSVRAAFTVTQPSDGWPGRRGRIDAALLLDAGADPTALFYVCGPPGMAESIAGHAIDIGASPDRVLFEQWW